MFKHPEKFQLMVVEDYLGGTSGFKEVAKRHQIAAPMVRKWVALFQQHGIDGLKRKVSQYDAAFKLKVLQYMWDNSLSYAKAAAVFNIRNATSVGTWDRRFRDEGLAALARPSNKELAKVTSTDNQDTKDDAPESGKTLTMKEVLAENQQLRMEVAVLKKLKALALAREAASAKKKRK